jgi:hypothetical protein
MRQGDGPRQYFAEAGAGARRERRTAATLSGLRDGAPAQTLSEAPRTIPPSVRGSGCGSSERAAMKESTPVFVLRKRARQLSNLVLARSRELAGWAPPAPQQRLIFVISNGRSGTGMLASAFGAFGGLTALHEPKPDFRHLRPVAARNPSLAKEWLRLVKLPDIAARGGDIYVETSHIFAKGFLEPALELGVAFDIVLLKRPPREIACSMAQLPAIPGASLWARSFYVSPTEPNFLPVETRELTDYQKCYWHALETERRQNHYAKTLRALGRRVVSIDARDLGDEEKLVHMFECLDMNVEKLDRTELKERISRRVNLKHHEKDTACLRKVRLDDEEGVVRQALAV